jgi:hypothetical protein
MTKNNVASFPSNHFSHKSGNGNGGDDLEARVAKLESDVNYIKRDISEIKSDIRDIKHDQRSDFRLLFGAVIAVALGLAGIMAKGFGWL